MVGVGAWLACTLMAGQVAIEDPDGVLARVGAPVCAPVALGDGPVGLRAGDVVVPAQYDGRRLWWLLPPGPAGTRTFTIVAGNSTAPAALTAGRDEASGQWWLKEGDAPILRYNYATIEPGPLFDKVAPGNRIYCRARSDYIHPLYGLHGEVLTKDFSLDHPHHRGIYWAWPEVDWGAKRGDLHALQHVFARPTGKLEGTSGPLYAELRAENEWRWEDEQPVVREVARLRAWRATPAGRWLDLRFSFTALVDGVTVARRGTEHYGGLNIRLAAVDKQQITFHTDPPTAQPRLAWADLWGTFAGAKEPGGVGVLPWVGHPGGPPDWVQYPNLNWFQPTFPAAKTRYALSKDKPLVLSYRLWLRPGGAPSETAYADQWRAWQALGASVLEEQP